MSGWVLAVSFSADVGKDSSNRFNERFLISPYVLVIVSSASFKLDAMSLTSEDSLTRERSNFVSSLVDSWYLLEASVVSFSDARSCILAFWVFASLPISDAF